MSLLALWDTANRTTKELRLAITPTHSTHNATVAVTTALAANTNRRYLLLQNNSDTNIRFTLDGTNPSATNGITLYANGQSLEFGAHYGNNVQGAVKVIHFGAGNKALDITEGV